MMKIVILVCAAALDHAACDETNAVDVVRAMRVPSAQQCGFLAQSLIAQTSLAPRPDQFMKVVCLREKEARR